MGFFKNLFGGNQKQEENSEPIDITKEFNVVDYERGIIYDKISSISYSQTYENFGIKGVQLHQQIKTHFKTIDILYDYFNNRESKDVIDKRYWKTEDTNRYNFYQLQQVINDRKLRKSHDVSLNLNNFLETKRRVYKELITKIKTHGFPKTDGTSNLRSYIGNRRELTFVELEHTNDFSVLDVFTFLFGEDGEKVINKLQNQVIGWNSVCLLTPFHLINTDYDVVKNSTVILSSDYNTFDFNLIGLELKNRNISRDFFKSIKRWKSIYELNYFELFTIEYKEITEVIEKESNLISQIQEIKKNSFDIHENNEEFTNDIQMITRHLNQITENINSVFENVLVRKKNDASLHHSRGYLYPNLRIHNSYGYIEEKIFEFSVIKNLSEMMIECVKSNNRFLYKEIYLILEPYHIFDRTIEKQTLQELKDLNKGLSELNNNLNNLNRTLSRGFKMISDQLSSIDNKLWYNNLLTTINTYQLYKISKK